MTATLIGILSIVLAVISYALYIRNTVTGNTKPHSMTWLIWSALNFFIFFAQLEAGAGAGAWVTGGAGIGAGIIFALSLWHGEHTITKLDYVLMGLVAIMLLLWSQTGDAVTAVWFALAIFLLGFLPTLRKATTKPLEETATSFALNGAKFFLSFIALSSVTFVTAAYPLMLFVVNFGFAIYLVIMRQQQKHAAQKRRVNKRTKARS